MSSINNPEGWFINGELAGEADLGLMEGLAWDLLKDFPAEDHRQYGYETDGSTVLFSTHVFEDEAELGSVASVTLDTEDTQLQINFGYDNNPSPYLSLSSPEEFVEITCMLQGLIDGGQLQLADSIILRHLQVILFRMMSDGKLDPTDLLPNADPNQKPQNIADMIRSHVRLPLNWTHRLF